MYSFSYKLYSNKPERKGLNPKSNSESLRKRAGMKCSSPVDTLLIFKYRRHTLLLRAKLYSAEYGKGNKTSLQDSALQCQVHVTHHDDNLAKNIKPTHKNRSFSIKEIKYNLSFVPPLSHSLGL